MSLVKVLACEQTPAGTGSAKIANNGVASLLSLQ